jgi:autotransporter strand-loop-strand O-heptosyltransferase
MSKILYITPHLSTGGLPQYLYKKIEKLSKNTNHDLYVLEWEDIAPIYRVQKDLIKNIIPKSNFVSWDQGTNNNIKINDIINLIKQNNFDVIHIEEFPEMFLPREVISIIYNNVRKYKIIETSHSSGFSPIDKMVLPDAFVFVSQYQVEKFKRFNIPSYLAEYPIENYSKINKKIELDPDYKHVLNVGLFIPGKNQGYAFEIAKVLGNEKIKFHFIGNQAENFRSYWEPLMKNVPSNCIIHGERDDVNDWYASCDLLLFTSKSELNPLVPREAISWGLPVLMYNLPIYLNEYSNYSNVTFLTGKVFEDSNRVKKALALPYENIVFEVKEKPKIKLVHLLTRPNDEREQKSISCLSQLRNYGIDYIQHINEPCTVYPDILPAIEHDEKRPGYYGAYLSFRRAIEEEFDDNLDFLMVCECDCYLSVDPETFYNRLIKICEKVKQYEIDYFSFGPHIDNLTGEVWTKVFENLDDEIFIGDRVILARCIMFRKEVKEHLLKQYLRLPWDSPDMWLNDAMMRVKKIGLLYHPLAEQYEDQSIIDPETKGTLTKIARKNIIEVLENVYSETTITNKRIDRQLEINCHFGNGAFAEVIDHTIVLQDGLKKSSETSYHYEFFDSDKNELIYEITIPPNHYSLCHRKYFTNWLVKIKKEDQLIYQHKLNLKDKRVLISFESSSLGDSIAWIPYVEEFRLKNECEVICSTFWNNLFKKSYPNINFVAPGTVSKDIYAGYSVGCFMPPDDKNRHPVDWRNIPLQRVASDILGLQFKEIKAKIDLPEDTDKVVNERYICIGIHSTCQAKYWNYPYGWQKLVNYFKSIGYEIVHISKEVGKYMNNKPPTNVINKTGNSSIEKRINQLRHADMFISISSGLSWLSWGLGIPTVIISGVTKPFNEPESMIKIHNYDVCNGCFNNTDYTFDKGNWHWCPNKQNFICSRSITPEDVINTIKPILLKDANVKDQVYWNEEEKWENNGENWSEGVGGSDKIWNDFLYPHIKDYIRGNVTEIGPGLGRITKYLVDYCKKLNLVDLNQYCIDKCKERFNKLKFVDYYINNGKDLPNNIHDNSQDLIISFDCFVHLHQTVIDHYLGEIYRKLKPNSIACLHHSNFGGGEELSFHNYGGRSNMFPEIFKALCEKNNFQVLNQNIVQMNEKLKDCITVIKKPLLPPRLIIFTGIYNGQEYIAKCIDSIKKQNYINFKCFIVDDVSTDNTVKEAIKAINCDSRFSIIINEEKLWGLENVYQTLNRSDISDLDVVVIVDGDDFLPDESVFDRIVNEYTNEKALLTYGSFNQIQNGDLVGGWAEKTDPKNIRKIRWTATHLRTFYVKLFRAIKKEDLIDKNTGKFYQYAADMALMMPMIEMADDRAHYLSSINYTYNDMNPINEYKLNRQKQLDCEAEIRALKSYPRFED